MCVCACVCVRAETFDLARCRMRRGLYIAVLLAMTVVLLGQVERYMGMKGYTLEVHFPGALKG